MFQSSLTRALVLSSKHMVLNYLLLILSKPGTHDRGEMHLYTRLDKGITMAFLEWVILCAGACPGGKLVHVGF